MKKTKITSKVDTQNGSRKGLFETAITKHVGVEESIRVLDKIAIESDDPQRDYLFQKIERFEQASIVEAKKHCKASLSELPAGEPNTSLLYAQKIMQHCGSARQYIEQQNWILALGRLADVGEFWKKWHMAAVEEDFIRGRHQRRNKPADPRKEPALKEWKTERPLNATDHAADKVIAKRHGTNPRQIYRWRNPKINHR